MPREEESSPEMAERVDEALAALWEGKTGKLDQLLQAEDGVGPGVGELLGGVASARPGAGVRPERIANYEIIGELGRGGMGVVYEAQQQDPQRRVALKVVRGGHFVDDQRIKLFQREVQTLARLKHPNIAAIYEAGCTDDGQHFFAMELVRGATLTEYVGDGGTHARRESLHINERLRLFVRICEAINYAHQRGVIHRDLKPSNILVTDESSAGGSESTVRTDADVKVLDFGLARITDADVAVTTITTDTGKIKGTLAYMSPEQARGDPVEIDIRSDVYSLGVVLYELLTGKLPLNLKHRPVADAVRALRDDPAPRPSSIKRTLREDLDTIALKALEKEPARRYQSAAALADDILRYLRDQPILARPPSAVYQLRKLVARHKLGFAALVFAATASLVGLGVSTSLYFKTRAARVAESEQRVIAEQICVFLTDMLASVNPRKAAGQDVGMLRELLDEASNRVGEQFIDEPRVLAPIRHTIGKAFLSLGMYDEAEPHLVESLRLLSQLFGAEDARTLAAGNDAATLLQDQGKLDEAETEFVRILDIRSRTLGDEHPDTLTSMNGLGNLYAEQEKLTDSERIFRDTLTRRQRVLGDEHPDTLVSMNNLSNALSRQGRYADAEVLIRESLTIQRRVLPPEHLDLFVSMNDLAVALKRQGKLAEAEPVFKRVVDGFRRVLGDGHMDTLITTNNLAGLLRAQGEVDESAELYRQLIASSEASLPTDHYLTAMFHGGYGKCLMTLNRFDEAETQLLQALDGVRNALGDQHTYTKLTAKVLAELYETWQKPAEAATYREMSSRRP